jgi:hypothetical protein
MTEYINYFIDKYGENAMEVQGLATLTSLEDEYEYPHYQF